MQPLPYVAQNGPKIAELRKKRKMTLAALASAASPPPPAPPCNWRTIKHLEDHTRSASDMMLRRIARALGVKSGTIRRPDADEEPQAPGAKDEAA
jgi:transcriptional regulator with XRE-family HTH domain